MVSLSNHLSGHKAGVRLPLTPFDKLRMSGNEVYQHTLAITRRDTNTGQRYRTLLPIDRGRYKA